MTMFKNSNACPTYSQTFECSSISMSGKHNNGIFSTPKMGYVRIVKNTFKFTYMIQLQPLVGSTDETKSIPFSKHALAHKKIKTNEKFMISLKNDGVIYIVIKNPDEVQVFEKLLTECIEDESVVNDEKIFGIANNENKKIITEKIPKQVNPMKTASRIVIEDMDKLVSTPKVLSTNRIKKLQPINELLKSNTTNTPAPAANNPSISKIRFYNNDKENSKAYDFKITRPSYSSKRPVSEISYTNDEYNNVSTQYTPKRNRCDRISPICLSSKSPSPSVNNWNRTNSMGNSVGKGFSNLGNTCYMNAILQCLLNIEPFSNDLISNKNDKLPKSSLYNTLCGLYQARDTNNEFSKTEALKEVKNSISQEATRFSGYQQHDAHEFLCQVLDQLKEDIDKLRKHTERSTETTSNINEDLKITNPIVNNFEFQVMHTINCTACPEVITKKEEFNNLCLEIPKFKSIDKRISLQDALDVFFNDESVTFNCEKCRNNQVVIKHKFKKLPRILILYLKRYQLEDGKNLVKNDCSIDIQRYLTLNWLCDKTLVELPPTYKYERPISKDDNEPLSHSSIQIRKLTTKPPLTNHELNQQQQQQIRTSNKLEFRNSNPPYTSPLPLLNSTTLNKTPTSKSKKVLNFDDNKFKKYDTSFSISEIDFQDKASYDQHTYALKDLSEEEQIKMAMDLSLKAPSLIDDKNQQQKQRQPFKSLNQSKFEVYNEDNPNVSYSGNEHDVCYVDGVFDNDENENENNEDEDEELKKIYENECEKDAGVSVRRRENLQTYANRGGNKPVKTKKDHENNINHIINRLKSSDSLENFADIQAALPVSESKDFHEDIFGEYKIEENLEKHLLDDSDEKSKIIAAPDEPEYVTLNRTEEQERIIQENSKNGAEENSYRIIGIVNHLGVSSNSGHYISDVYNVKTNLWSSYDDKKVEILKEDEVLEKRSKTAYIFFYMHNSILTNSI